MSGMVQWSIKELLKTFLFSKDFYEKIEEKKLKWTAVASQILN